MIIVLQYRGGEWEVYNDNPIATMSDLIILAIIVNMGDPYYYHFTLTTDYKCVI